MPGLCSAGVARRAALVPEAIAAAGQRAFGMKQQPRLVPAPRSVMRRHSSSATRVDVKDAAGVAPRAVAIAGERAFGMKRQRAAPCELLDPKKRVKVSHGAAVKTPATTGHERLKKRLAVELDALRELVEKAKLLSSGKNGRFLSRSKNGRSLPDEPRPVVASGKVPSAKRIKTSPIVEKIGARQMSPEEGEIVADEECIDICGGASPVAICAASPLVSVEKADEPKINIVPAAEQDEYVDICGGATPLLPLQLTSEACSPMSSGSDSESSSSSDSDSGSDSDDSSSDSDSDSDEVVSSPAPAAVPPKESNSPAHLAEDNISVEPASETEQSTQTESTSEESVSSPAPPPVLPKKMINSPAQPPASSKMVQSSRPDKKLPISVLLARAKEAREIREQRGNGWEREKTRRAVREMEKAVLPDESIHARDLAKVGIIEFQYVLGNLGISLRPDV